MREVLEIIGALGHERPAVTLALNADSTISAHTCHRPSERKCARIHSEILIRVLVRSIDHSFTGPPLAELRTTAGSVEVEDEDCDVEQQEKTDDDDREE